MLKADEPKFFPPAMPAFEITMSRPLSADLRSSVSRIGAVVASARRFHPPVLVDLCRL